MRRPPCVEVSWILLPLWQKRAVGSEGAFSIINAIQGTSEQRGFSKFTFAAKFIG
jgi:hypothetical protein